MLAQITNVEQLEDILSEPSDGVVKTLGELDGDIIVLGAGGKMGPTLARMAKQASDRAGVSRRVMAVDLFPTNEVESNLRAHGIETLRCNLLNRSEIEALPNASNVVFMVGMKFGSTGQEPLTWAINSYLPGLVCDKYQHSRIVAFSTGNIYGLSPVTLGGSVETDLPNPTGEYATSALGRERIFEHFSLSKGTPTCIIRLNYAVEMRYGVLVDIAQKVWAGLPIDVTMGNVNVIWQGDAVAMTLRALELASSPAFILNVTGPEVLSIRRVAEQFGLLMNKEVNIVGSEAPDALLNNAQLAHKLFGYPRVSVQQMIQWIADWVMRGGESLGKPTHFEARDGKF